VPLPERELTPTRSDGELTDVRGRALEVLLSPDLAHVVDLVAYADGPEIEVAAARGRSRFRRTTPQEARLMEGTDPIGRQDALAADDAAPQYPWGRERLIDLFADAAAPDVAVVHTGGHYWPERGGHPGEHGSLNHVQSRAPLIVGGAGVTARGTLPRAARMQDTAGLLLHLAGAVPDAPERLRGIAEPVGAKHVVGLLWDGVNAEDLAELAAAGTLPAVARLLDRGCVLAGGSVAEFPSVTLTNHTSALTGVGPGVHGILNNAFYDRARAVQVVANESATWHEACTHLRPGVQTVFERVVAARPGVHTACVNEPVDRGAAYSTFGLVRAQHTGDGAKGMTSQLPDPTGDAHTTQRFAAENKDYAWGSSVDALGLAQVDALWQNAADAPALMWWNTTLTDSAHHAGGPRSEIARASLHDADRRLQAFYDRLDALGVADDTVIVLTSDHGSQAADPECRGDWDEALTAAGVPFRDEAYGFLYLG
jgi:hypothetical protein